LQGHGFEQMLKPRPLSVRAAAEFNEHANDCKDHIVDFQGWNDDSEIAGKCLVPRGAAQGDPKENFAVHADSLHADVIRVLYGTNQSTTIVGDVEFAWQVVKCAVIDDQLSEVVDKRQHVDQFNRIEAGSGVGGE